MAEDLDKNELSLDDLDEVSGGVDKGLVDYLTCFENLGGRAQGLQMVAEQRRPKEIILWIADFMTKNAPAEISAMNNRYATNVYWTLVR